ncbi:MAG TPA: bifunctional [glutamate--ammonia ligase]-adenylyl-L-tyrosine phosphorylase/[glutamate--ammonia-ligase] adenylyltransferase [Steroidobacteraceae bacterium]|nr:bifunctional [glutamate--ammonia ligase]-adenylyl-L-tyrosine phosphorylase/[glutamate--ammonia-ligase] adenylyltransferase [Steroidobacteraceae bacterium]
MPPGELLDRFAGRAELRACLQRELEALESASPGRLDSLPSAVRDSLPRVFAASDFVAQACVRDGGLLSDLIGPWGLTRRAAPGDIAARAPQEGFDSDAQMMAALRCWRRREMVRIAWRELAGWAQVEETLADLSDFADAAIRVSVEHARQALTARYGEPRSVAGEAQPLVVLAMGKLGGRELNFSSDVDLVLLFPEHGETDGARPIANEEFFTRLGQSLIRLLETATSDGFTLRVDMRLRPFGDSGPLVTSFASLEDYLPLHGRDWERYAYVKARPVTAADRYAEIRASALGPFVYRRYLDYGVFESLREMKALIEREVERRELAGHIKLGPGGIREIEFMVQAFQLIRGGRERRLQTSSLLQALEALGELQVMPGAAVADLRAAYLYLRRLENSLQMLADGQVHQLPTDRLSRERVALAMGAPDWETLLGELGRHQGCVSGHFNRFVFGAGREGREAVRIDLGRSWETQAETAVLSESLGRAGFVESAQAAQMLLALRASALVRKLDEPGRRRLQALLPPLLADIGSARLPGAEQLAVLRRIVSILEATGKRSTYFSLLRESQAARSRLIEICRHGEFLVRQIASHPLLLDELADTRPVAELPGREALARELQAAMEQVPDDDPERQVEALCHFQRAAIFRVAVADLTGRLPVMRVSDRLTEIAELIIERAIQLAWAQITAQFGVPHCGEGPDRRPVSICAVGYGKLGGFELGYASDLDLVFLHDSRGERQETEHSQGVGAHGARPIDNSLFFVRLAQRLMHLLTMHSAAGRLYEVDVRLRPSGKGGLLVTQIDAFGDYQRTEAWTWEHQALLHARAVAGAPALCAQFERIRLDVLRYAVRRETLRDEVRSMRERMRRELSRGGSDRLDLKQDAGGIADIEFLAQYWALEWARDHPPVAMFSDTIRQLESVASANLVPQATVDVLTAAYRAYRTRMHHQSLAGEAGLIRAEEFTAERSAVTAVWEEVMGRAATV